MTRLTPTRQLAYQFLRLPFYRRMVIVRHLGLLTDADRNVPDNKRFPLAFRRASEPEAGDTLIRRDNTFGTPEEDAFRRDFTVNALFYDIANFSVIDWVGGLVDVEARVIRTIGDPGVRFREDPVRMLRAVALAARLDFHVDQAHTRWGRGEHVTPGMKQYSQNFGLVKKIHCTARYSASLVAPNPSSFARRIMVNSHGLFFRLWPG